MRMIGAIFNDQMDTAAQAARLNSGVQKMAQRSENGRPVLVWDALPGDLPLNLGVQRLREWNRGDLDVPVTITADYLAGPKRAMRARRLVTGKRNILAFHRVG